MQQIIITLALMILSTQTTILSMDLPTQTVQQTCSGLSEDQIIAKINEAINKKYASEYYLLDLLYSLPLNPKNFLDILQIAYTHYPHITDSAIKKLSSDNSFFAKAIDYFNKKALQNLRKITANNIKTIENPKNQQPIDELNKLQLIFKTYVMHEALQHAQELSDFKYDIVLKDDELTDPITAFDICPPTHQAITSSIAEQNNSGCKNYSGKLVLWNLKTGKPIYTLETEPIYIITLSADGSQFAGAVYNENIITVRCTKTKELLHKLITSDPGITSLSFSYPTPFLLTALYGDHLGNMYDVRIKQWMLTSADNKTGELINHSYYFGGRSSQSAFSNDQYSASHPYTYLKTPSTELHITKKGCDPLYLCTKAITNSPTLEQKQIESSASFHNLTDLEIPKVYGEMQKRLASLQQKK